MATAIAVENWRRPRLRLSIESPPNNASYPTTSPAQQLRIVRVKLFNKPLPRFGKWMVRAPALQCRASITFHHLDGQNVFGRVMDGRWSGSPQPVPMTIVGPGGQQFSVIDYDRLTMRSRIDVYSGETEWLDIASKADNDVECYGWNNETYFSIPQWRNPSWKLAAGRYLVRVLVGSSGQEGAGYFRLINDVSRTDFRLEAANRKEKKLLKSQSIDRARA
jgi:hypothetical protein